MRTSSFTSDEDKIILDYITRNIEHNSNTIPKNVWKHIKDTLLPTRTEISIKNRFYRFINPPIQWIPSKVQSPAIQHRSPATQQGSSQSQSQSTPNNVLATSQSLTFSPIPSQSSSQSSEESFSQETLMLNKILFEEEEEELLPEGNPLPLSTFQHTLITQIPSPSDMQVEEEENEPMSFADEWTEESDEEIEEELMAINNVELMEGEEDENWSPTSIEDHDLLICDQYLILKRKIAWLSYITEVKEISIMKLVHLFGADLSSVYRYATHNYNYATNTPWTMAEDQAIMSGNRHHIQNRSDAEIAQRRTWLTSSVCMKLSMELF